MIKVYINNAFSTKMLTHDVDVRFIFIDEDEFRDAIAEADEIIIGHQDTADYFNVPLNRKTITLNKGDELYVCEANSKDGGRLPSGTEFLEQMGEDFYFRFIKIEMVGG